MRRVAMDRGQQVTDIAIGQQRRQAARLVGCLGGHRFEIGPFARGADLVVRLRRTGRSFAQRTRAASFCHLELPCLACGPARSLADSAGRHACQRPETGRCRLTRRPG